MKFALSRIELAGYRKIEEHGRPERPQAARRRPPAWEQVGGLHAAPQLLHSRDLTEEIDHTDSRPAIADIIL
jgi:hypothetical protein